MVIKNKKLILFVTLSFFFVFLIINFVSSIAYYCEWSWPQKIINKDTGERLYTCPMSNPYCKPGTTQCCKYDSTNKVYYECIESGIGSTDSSSTSSDSESSLSPSSSDSSSSLSPESSSSTEDSISPGVIIQESDISGGEETFEKALPKNESSLVKSDNQTKTSPESSSDLSPESKKNDSLQKESKEQENIQEVKKEGAKSIEGVVGTRKIPFTNIIEANVNEEGNFELIKIEKVKLFGIIPANVRVKDTFSIEGAKIAREQSWWAVFGVGVTPKASGEITITYYCCNNPGEWLQEKCGWVHYEGHCKKSSGFLRPMINTCNDKCSEHGMVGVMVGSGQGLNGDSRCECSPAEPEPPKPIKEGIYYCCWDNKWHQQECWNHNEDFCSPVGGTCSSFCNSFGKEGRMIGNLRGNVVTGYRCECYDSKDKQVNYKCCVNSSDINNPAWNANSRVWIKETENCPPGTVYSRSGDHCNVYPVENSCENNFCNKGVFENGLCKCPGSSEQSTPPQIPSEEKPIEEIELESCAYKCCVDNDDNPSWNANSRKWILSSENCPPGTFVGSAAHCNVYPSENSCASLCANGKYEVGIANKHPGYCFCTGNYCIPPPPSYDYAYKCCVNDILNPSWNANSRKWILSSENCPPGTFVGSAAHCNVYPSENSCASLCANGIFEAPIRNIHEGFCKCTAPIFEVNAFYCCGANQQAMFVNASVCSLNKYDWKTWQGSNTEGPACWKTRCEDKCISYGYAGGNIEENNKKCSCYGTYVEPPKPVEDLRYCCNDGWTKTKCSFAFEEVACISNKKGSCAFECGKENKLALMLGNSNSGANAFRCLCFGEIKPVEVPEGNFDKWKCCVDNPSDPSWTQRGRLWWPEHLRCPEGLERGNPYHCDVYPNEDSCSRKCTNGNIVTGSPLINGYCDCPNTIASVPWKVYIGTGQGTQAPRQYGTFSFSGVSGSSAKSTGIKPWVFSKADAPRNNGRDSEVSRLTTYDYIIMDVSGPEGQTKRADITMYVSYAGVIDQLDTGIKAFALSGATGDYSTKIYAGIVDNDEFGFDSGRETLLWESKSDINQWFIETVVTALLEGAVQILVPGVDDVLYDAATTVTETLVSQVAETLDCTDYVAETRKVEFKNVILFPERRYRLYTKFQGDAIEAAVGLYAAGYTEIDFANNKPRNCDGGILSKKVDYGIYIDDIVVNFR